MRIGSIVETVGDFEGLRREWGFPYPRKGDALTVRSILVHPVPELAAKGIVLLRFEELPNLVGVCDKDVNGNPNFVELLLPENLMEDIGLTKEILNQ